MKKEINTDNAPSPVGPYNQAVIAGGFLYISGQIALLPKSGAMVQETVKAETVQVMDNLKAIVSASGATMDQLVKVSIFLSDIDLFAEVNDVYGSYFTCSFPARETVAVAGLPKGARVEISAIAYLG